MAEGLVIRLVLKVSDDDDCIGDCLSMGKSLFDDG